MQLYTFVQPLGIVTLVSLLITVTIAFLKITLHIRWISMKWHVWSAVITVLLALIHAGIVIYLKR